MIKLEEMKTMKDLCWFYFTTIYRTKLGEEIERIVNFGSFESLRIWEKSERIVRALVMILANDFQTLQIKREYEYIAWLLSENVKRIWLKNPLIPTLPFWWLFQISVLEGKLQLSH